MSYLVTYPIVFELWSVLVKSFTYSTAEVGLFESRIPGGEPAAEGIVLPDCAAT